MIDKLKTALILVLIGAISGLLIYGANQLTEDGIIQIRADREQAYYKDIFDVDGAKTITFDEQDLDGVIEAELTIYDDASNVLGYIYRGSETNTYGSITVLIGIRQDGTIAEVVISNTTNTPIFVNAIKTDYLPNFVNQNSDNISFDAKTGASYTYGSVTKFVDAAVTYFNLNRGEANE